MKIWIGNQPNPDDRLKIEVSDSDAARLPLREPTGRVIVTVRDVNTGKQYRLRSAACGAECRCALEIVPPMHAGNSGQQRRGHSKSAQNLCG